MLLILVSATVLVLGSTPPFRAVRSAAADALSPLRSFGSTVTSPLRDWFGSVGDYKELRRENERLRGELDAYKGREAQVQDALRERRELANLSRLEVVDELPSVTARVYGASLSNFESTIEIDRGSTDGVDVGMPVVTGAGLVGRILSVNRGSARVVLLWDAESRTGVRLSRSGDVGVALGNAPGSPLGVVGIDPDTVIEPGESVVTAGMPGARYPAGIPVGTVRSATVRPGSLEQEVLVDPLAELGSVTFVKVLLWRPPAPPPVSGPSLPTVPAGDVPPAAAGSVVPGEGSGTVVSLDPSQDPVGDPTPITDPPTDSTPEGNG